MIDRKVVAFRRWLLIGLFLAVLIVAAGVALLGGLSRTVEPDVSLIRPAPGQVRADYLPDGAPVWVVGHQDGSVDVLSGFDTHVPYKLGKLLWWCPSARGLENPHYGSRWDECGLYLAGAAPTGLSS